MIYEKNNFTLNITQAKEELKRICTTYLNDSNIPFNRQRPVMLMGPAGIGKTDIPKQAAEELEIGFVSYSITHHTRQSALGLPKIISKNYNGEEVLVTEYTASEIIASVMDEIKNSGNEKGILFIDEVNCASETLTAPLLQLYQNKTLGTSRLPEGWVLVLAGNPGEYNRSAKEFDAVTRDRLRVIDIVPDPEAWLLYAENKNLNPTVISYVSLMQNNFYSFEEDEGIVTPRGWEELAINFDIYEKNNYPITPAFIKQFIGSQRIAMDFYNHTNMVKNVISDKEAQDILAGTTDEKFMQKIPSLAKNMRFVLTVFLNRKLKGMAKKNPNEAGEYFDNALEFLEKAFSNGGEKEIFMNSVINEPELVSQLIIGKNEIFLAYIENLSDADSEIRKMMKNLKEVK